MESSEGSIHHDGDKQSSSKADSWTGIYNMYAQDLFRFGSQFTHDRELVIDSIHDVFFSLLKKQRKMEKIDSIKSYLFSSVYRTIIYHVKRNGQVRPEENLVNEFSIEFSVQSKLISDEAHKQKMTDIKGAMDKLSSKQRQVILHYYYDGFLHEEIAAIMGLKNAHTVSKLLSRAIKSIRENLVLLTLLLLSWLSAK